MSPLTTFVAPTLTPTAYICSSNTYHLPPQESYERAVQLLKTHSVEHRRLAEALLKHETLTADEIRLAVAGKTISKKL